MLRVFALLVAFTTAAAPGQMAAAQSVRIVPLGDSITQGDAAHNSYRRALAGLLAGAGYDVDLVGSRVEHHPMGPPPTPDFDADHEGHWGIVAGQLRMGLPTWLVSYDADIALLHIGTNDAFFGADPNTTANEVTGIIEALRQDVPSMVVLLAQVIPTGNASRNPDIVLLNQALAGVAASTNTPESRVVLVDHFSNFDTGALLYDGIHPNEAGEQEMANRWFAALAPVLDGMNQSSGDAGMDAGLDAGTDAGMNTRPDGGPDAGMDAGTNMRPDGGPGATPDAGEPARPDAGPGREQSNGCAAARDASSKGHAGPALLLLALVMTTRRRCFAASHP